MLNKTIIVLSIFIIGCSTTKVCSPQVSMFYNDSKKKTSINEVLIYKSRLEVPCKYEEIGIVKYVFNCAAKELKKIMEGNGADALIQDGNNYILIIFVKQNGEGNDKENFS